MTLAVSPASDAVLPHFADVQWVAFACVLDGTKAIEVYLVPAPRITADMQEAHRQATAHRGTPSGSKVRILYMGDRPHRPGWCYAEKYREFRVGEPVDPGVDAIRRAQQIVADEFHVPPEAVHISVELTSRSGLVYHAPAGKPDGETTAH